jgi:hypothetical protein
MNMKVYEVISEQTVNESLLGLVGKAGAKLFGKVMSKSDFIEHEAANIANLVKTRGISVGEAVRLSDAMKTQSMNQYVTSAIKNAQVTGKKLSPAELSKIKSEAAEAAGFHPSFSKDPAIAKKIASKAEGALGGEMLGKIGIKGVKSSWDLLRKAIKGTVTLWGWYELATPLMEFREQMMNAQSQVDAGKWTAEEYQGALNQQTTILITKMAALMVGGGIFKLLSSPLRGPLMSKVPGLATVLLGGQNAVRTWINNESNSTAIAAFVANEIPGLADLVGGALSPFMKPLLKYSGAGTGTPSGATPSDGAAAPAGTTNGTNGNTAQQDIGSTSSTPAAGASTSDTGDIDPKTGKTKMGRKMWSVDPNAVNNYDITGWVQKPLDPHSIVDPKNPANFLPKPDTYTWTPY